MLSLGGIEPGATLRHTRRYGESGFTAAELMFVVAILGILVSMAVLAFSAATGRALEASCRANQRIIQTGVYEYQIEEGSLPTTLTAVEPLVRTSGTFGICPADESVTYDYDPATGFVSCVLHP